MEVGMLLPLVMSEMGMVVAAEPEFVGMRNHLTLRVCLLQQPSHSHISRYSAH